MKARTFIALSVTSIATLFSAATFAQTAAPTPVPTNSEARQARIDARQANQQKRIDQGKASGQLTDKEAGNLQKREDRINKMEANAQKDGKIGPREARRIQRAENKASRKIYNKKHNDQVK